MAIWIFEGAERWIYCFVRDLDEVGVGLFGWI